METTLRAVSLCNRIVARLHTTKAAATLALLCLEREMGQLGIKPDPLDTIHKAVATLIPVEDR
jgi:hypothetical protein